MEHITRVFEYGELKREIGTEEYRALLEGLKSEDTFMRQFESWHDVVRFMRMGRSQNREKEKILRAVLGAHAGDNDPRWRTILLVIFWPGLESIHTHKRGWDADPEDFWQNILWTFLQVILRIDLTRRSDRLVQKLINDTIHRLADKYRTKWKYQHIEKFVNSTPKDGWLTTEWKGMYPRKREIRRYIDGLVLATKDYPGGKLHTARAIASRLLQTMYSDSGSGYSTRNWETIPDVKRILGHAIKEVNGLIAEVGGKGKVTNLDARKTTFPKSDVVYFDPPFFRKDKGHVLYFNSYKVANSVLLQEQWKEADLKKEEAVDILHRLCKSTGHIFVSSARNCEVPWAAEVALADRRTKNSLSPFSGAQIKKVLDIIIANCFNTTVSRY